MTIKLLMLSRSFANGSIPVKIVVLMLKLRTSILSQKPLPLDNEF